MNKILEHLSNRRSKLYALALISALLIMMVTGVLATSTLVVSPSNIVLSDGSGNLGYGTGTTLGNITTTGNITAANFITSGAVNSSSLTVLGTATIGTLNATEPWGNITGTTLPNWQGTWNGTVQQIEAQQADYVYSVSSGNYYANNRTGGNQLAYGTNCSAMLQNTLTSNESVYFTSGAYVINYNGSLSGISNLQIGGSPSAIISLGTQNVTLFLFGATQNPASTDAQNITVTNLLFEGNYPTITITTDKSINDAFNIIGAQNCLWQGCTFKDWANHAIVAGTTSNASSNRVVGCSFYNGHWFDVAFAGPTLGNNLVSGCTLSNTYGLEMNFNNAMVGNTFNNCSMEACTYTGANNVFTGNLVNNMLQYALLVNVGNQTISGNTFSYITKNVGNALDIASNNNNIVGNSFYGCWSGNGNQFRNIGLYSASFNNINGNYFYGKGTNSIGVFVYDAPSTNNTICGNYFYNCVTGLSDAGVGTVFVNNVVYSATTPYTAAASATVHNNMLNGTWTP